MPEQPPDIADHLRDAINAGHLHQVTVICDGCGAQETGHYPSNTREMRFAAARRHAESKGWAVGDDLRSKDWCPACKSAPIESAPKEQA